MSKADEMFKELGYELVNHYDVITKTIFMYDGRFANGRKKRIAFYEGRTITCSEDYLYTGKFNMQELKAINEKCKELGWLDE